MSRLALAVVSVLTAIWIVLSLLLIHGWTTGTLLRTLATWLVVPMAAWLVGLGWAALRRRSCES